MASKPYKDLTPFQVALSTALGIPSYFVFARLDQPFRGFVAAVSLSILVMLFLVLEPLRNRRQFWPALALVAVGHITLVFLLPFTGEFSLGFAYFPLFFADAYLCGRFIIRVCGAKLAD